MKILTLTILLFTFFNISAQDLVPFYEYKKSSLSQEYLLNQSELHLNSENELYYKDKIIFSPIKDYRYCIYEMLEDRFLIISSINESDRYSQILYLLPKHKIKILDLKLNRWYEYNLKGNSVISISEKNEMIDLEYSECKSLHVNIRPLSK
ncbi:hypothetical protein [Flavobacterium defluvii]|uniref:Uncharacterized protein n=1 Tax=Flavobacterium defluvii TaxID=370979 RepID=A0A1M5E7D3_9FLAO|nr:hypothetical protein [Flavobacterium defluvii]SHF75137.1 hypothetical protein SAMN05443663_10152 [Flavobacterium defluvii]